MTGNIVQLIGSLIALSCAAPLLGHPYRQFAFLRYSLGVTMLAAAACMLVFMLTGHHVAAATVGLCGSALGWYGGGWLVRLMKQHETLTRRKRRRALRAPVTPLVLTLLSVVVTVIGLLLTVFMGGGHS
jgi:hypothetical protein